MTGTLSGYVRDPSGGAIPNATVTATMVEQQTTGIHSIQSGTPITFLMGTDVALDGTFGGQHAELAPGVTVKNIELSHPNRAAMVDQFFNTAAFVSPNNVAPGTYGNAGRGLISGPAFSNTDLSILKNFALREALRLQFRTEMFNAFNQVNFGNPDSTVTSGTFGKILSAQDGRTVQFALKLLW